MKMGIMVYSNDSETVWNAFRFANFALKEGDEIVGCLAFSLQASGGSMPSPPIALTTRLPCVPHPTRRTSAIA
ncbi:MAG: hypothetical protein K8R25_03415 [Methanosarcinales archaeon]|nr:hypothetical protein [Methanosarcinales archaeon]